MSVQKSAQIDDSNVNVLGPGLSPLQSMLVSARKTDTWSFSFLQAIQSNTVLPIEGYL